MSSTEEFSLPGCIEKIMADPSRENVALQLGICTGTILKEISEEKASLRVKNAELEHLYKLQSLRMVEATRRWRIAHPGKEGILPDLGELLYWLLEEIDKQEHA